MNTGNSPCNMHEPEAMSSRPGSANNLPLQQVIALCPEYTKPRPEWVKFNFRDLTTSLKWKRMTLAQRGAYITLLAEQALNDCLPVAPEDIACVLACTGSNITESDALDAWKSPLMDCFTERNGGLGNPRMDRELGEYDALVSSKRQKKVEAGKKGASKRWQKDGKRMAPDSTAMANDALDRDRDVDRDLEKKRKKKPAKAPAPKKQTQVDLVLMNFGEDQPVWLRSLSLEWAAYRDDPQTKAKPIALVSWKKNLTKLGKLPEAVARSLIDAMIAGNWMGPVWENAQQAATQGPSAGGYCKAGPLHKVERNGMLSDIHMHYKQKMDNFTLPRDEALKMARAENHPIMHSLDWHEGRRNDPPPLNGTPSTPILEIKHEPTF